MGFGVTGGDGTISKTQNATVNVAEKISDVGNIAEMTAYGGAIETTIETSRILCFSQRSLRLGLPKKMR